MFESALKNGVELVLVMPNGLEVDFRHASVVGVEYLPIYEDTQLALSQVVLLKEKWQLEGIIAGKEHGVLFAALAAARLGLPGLPIEVAKNARSKKIMRELFAKAGLTVPKFVGIRDANDVSLCSTVPFPCVVKPASAASSDCVQLVEDAAQLVHACLKVDKANADVWDRYSACGDGSLSGIVVEEYLVGEEFAVEVFAVRGEAFALNCGYKGHPVGPYFEETIYLAPPNMDPDKIKEIQEVAVAGVQALGLENGPAHVELRLNHEGRPVILEIGARMGGGGCAHLNVEASTGIDYSNLVFLNALGELPRADVWPPISDGKGRAGSSWILPLQGSGKLRAIHGLDEVASHPDCERIVMCAEIGATYRPLPHFDGFLALIFGRHESPQAGERFFDFLDKNLRVVWDEQS
jgi:biotin carboxylase